MINFFSFGLYCKTDVDHQNYWCIFAERLTSVRPHRNQHFDLPNFLLTPEICPGQPKSIYRASSTIRRKALWIKLRRLKDSSSSHSGNSADLSSCGPSIDLGATKNRTGRGSLSKSKNPSQTENAFPCNRSHETCSKLVAW